MTRFSGTGKDNRGERSDFRRDEYDQQYAFYALDLTRNLATSKISTWPDMQSGATLRTTVTVVAYAEFENVAHVDRSCNV